MLHPHEVKINALHTISFCCEWSYSAERSELVTKLLRTNMCSRLSTATVTRRPSASVNSGSRKPLSGRTKHVYPSTSFSKGWSHKDPEWSTAPKRSDVHYGLFQAEEHDGNGSYMIWWATMHSIGPQRRTWTINNLEPNKGRED